MTPWVRHLLYFVYPIAGNGVWRRNVDQLSARIDLFDGRRTVAVATAPGPVTAPFGRGDHTLDGPDAVRAALPAGCDVVEVPANPDTGECVAFRPLWDSVSKHAGRRDATFYAHTKGVSYPADHPCVHTWTSILYSANLDFWPLVAADFAAGKSTTGAMRQHDGRGGRFIYSGNFFWARNRDLFTLKYWHHCRPRWAGIELWPGQLFGHERSGCVFKPYPPGLQAYDQEWITDLKVEFDGWREANKEKGTVWPERGA